MKIQQWLLQVKKNKGLHLMLAFGLFFHPGLSGYALYLNGGISARSDIELHPILLLFLALVEL